MRIAFDVSQTCIERTGCAWFADSLARALAEAFAATDDQLILYHHFDNWVNSSPRSGTTLHGAQVSAPMQQLSPKEARALWDALVRGKKPYPGSPQIVHSNNFNVPRVHGAKLVFTLYDFSFWICPEYTTESNRFHCQQGVLRSMMYADAYVFISENSRHEFEQLFPGWLEQQRKPWVVIPLGSRDSEHSRSLPTTDKSFWLTVGSLEPRKNHAAILDAMELYWQKSTRRLPLRIAGGSGWKSDALRARIHLMQQEGKVVSLGYVKDENLPNLYQGAKGFIFASWHEGFGLPLLEAMSHGCPVISSDRASLPEVGGDIPIYIDPSQPQQITDAMLRIESDGALAEYLSIKGIAQAAQFTWREAAEKTVKFYRSLL